MKKSLFLLIILIVNVLSVVIVIEDLYEQESPNIVLPRLDGGNFTYVSRSGGSSQGSSPDLATQDQSVGSGAEIQNMGIRSKVLDYNASHIFVSDPTTENTTDGIWIDENETYVEIARGSYGIHYYNVTEATYTFEGYDTFYTDNQWFTIDEYPNRFILRLTNGTIYFRYSVNDINTLISQIDNSTIWAIGFETIQGVFAFYMNFADSDWGHGQYLWYPRLKNGQLPAYNQPLYAFYLHLYAKFGGTWYDKILNDKNLYNSTNSPRNNLHFSNVSDIISISFNTDDVDILSSNWDLIHGFKFNSTEQRFHMINEFQCTDRDYQDIGFGYEITQSPQADDTPYEIDQIRVNNGTQEITLNVSEALQVGTYLNDFYSSVDFISILNSQTYQDPVAYWNETQQMWNATHTWNQTIEHDAVEGFWQNDSEVYNFDFVDMEEAGFTEKYLEIHNQSFPDGSWRWCLLAGMYGYGSYINNTWIEVDPVHSGDADDNEDLYRMTSLGGNVWYNSGTSMYSGTDGFGPSPEYFAQNWECFIAIDTSINEPVASITANTFRVYAEYDYMESGEGARVHVYNIGGNGNSNTAKENSHSYSLGTSDNEIWYAENFNPTGYDTFSTSKMDNMLEVWAANRGSSEEWVSFRFFNYGGDAGANDFFQIQDSQYGTSRDADISITYTVNNIPTVSNLVDGGAKYGGLYTVNDVDGRYSDADGYNNLDTIWLEVSNDNFATVDVILYYDYNEASSSSSDPSGYLAGLIAPDITPSGNNLDVTWYLYPDMDTNWDGTDLDFRIDCFDDSAAGATHLQDTGTGQTFDDELIFRDVDWTLSDSAYSDDGDTNLLDGEWFRGGVDVTATGTVTYEDSATTYPDTTMIEVGLIVDGVDHKATHKDFCDATGDFVISAWTTETGSNDVEAFPFEVIMFNWEYGSSSNEGTHIGNYEVTSSRDNQRPTLTGFDPMDYVLEGGDDEYLWASESSDTFYFNGISSYSATIEVGCTVSDGSGSGMSGGSAGVDYPSWGGSDPVKDTTAPFRGTYAIDGSETSGTIDVAFFDAVGNSGSSERIWANEDDTAPTMSIDMEVETSDYLHAGYGTDYQGLYGSGMGSLQSFGVDGSAFDTTGIATLTEDISDGWGNDPANSGSTESWYFVYQIDAADDGTKTITYTATDKVAFTNTISYTFYEDNGDPTITIDTEWENSDYLYKEYGGIDQGVYGSLMGSTQTYIIGGITADANGIASLSEDSGSWGNTAYFDGSLADWDYTYYIDAADDNDKTITFTTTDNVGNEGTDIYYFFEDNSPPTITIDTETETSDFLYSSYGSTSQGVYGVLMSSTENFLVGGITSDTYGIASLLEDISDGWGNDPSMSGSFADWDFTYQIDAADNGDKVITYTVTDNIGLTDTATYNFYEDGVSPTVNRQYAIYADTNTGQGYDPLWGYDDDTTLRQARGTISDNYGNGWNGRYQIDSEGWATGWTGFAYYDHTGVTDGNHTFTIIWRDDVNNTVIDVGWGICDTDDPDSFTFQYQRASGWIDGYGCYVADYLFTNPDINDYFTINILNDGDIGESGFYKVAWDLVGLGFQDLYDFSGLPDTKDFNYHNWLYSGFNLTHRIINNAGNYQQDTHNHWVDTIDPSAADITGEIEISDYLHAGYGTTYQGMYGSTMSSVQSFSVNGTAWDGGADIQFITDNSNFGDNPICWCNTTDWSFTYLIDADDNGDEVITYTAYDFVGNSRVVAQTYTFFEDNTAPTGNYDPSDSNSGVGFDPHQNYDDDSTIDSTVSTQIDSQSGIATTGYDYKIDAGSYSGWVASDTKQWTSIAEGNHTIYCRIRDNVNNIFENSSWVVIDSDDPYGFTLSSLQADGFNNGDYVYLTGSTIYFKSDVFFTFFITVNNDGEINNSEYWKIQWDTNSVFETVAFDTDALPETESFQVNSDSSGTFIIRIINKAGNYQEFSFTATEDTDAPTYDSFSLDVHPDAIDPNYWNTLEPNTTLVNVVDSISGLIPLFIEYSINDSWNQIAFTNDLTFTWTQSDGIFDQANHTLKFRLMDYVGNINQSNTDWVICDTISPELLVLSLDEMFAPNYYDQSVAHTANVTVTWIDKYPYIVDYAGVLAGLDDTNPSGGSSWINLTITGESNGWYIVNIAIWDKAGNSDSTLQIPTYGYGVIQLDNTLQSDEVEIWFYFYFFKSSGLGLDWKDYNTSYVIDEIWYPNTSLSRIRGGIFAQKFLNFTSTIRFEVRDYFGNLIHNTTYPLPTSRDIYIELAVNTFKTVNLYSDIVNMSLSRGTATFTEQLMPNEIFSWNLFAAEYNLTVYLHKYGTVAYDDIGNQLVNYTINLTSYDAAVFIRDIYEELCSILITDQSNNFLDPRGFKILIESTRIYGDTFLWNDTLTTKNITITDLFDNLVHQNLTTSHERFLEVVLSIWNLKVLNLDQDPIHLFINRNGRNVSEWILQYTFEEFYLLNGTYTMWFYYTDQADDYAVYNGTYVAKTAYITGDVVIYITANEIIAIEVAVDVPQPADPNIEVTVEQNNTEVVFIVENIRGNVDAVRGEINFIGSFLALSLLIVLVVILLALFLPQRYDELREKVADGRVKIYEKGEEISDQYFPEIEF